MASSSPETGLTQQTLIRGDKSIIFGRSATDRPFSSRLSVEIEFIRGDKSSSDRLIATDRNEQHGFSRAKSRGERPHVVVRVW